MKRITAKPQNMNGRHALTPVAQAMTAAGIACEVRAATASRGGDDDTDDLVAGSIRGCGYLYSDDPRAEDIASELYLGNTEPDTLGRLRAAVAYILTCCGRGPNSEARTWEAAVPFVVRRVVYPTVEQAPCMLSVAMPQPGRYDEYGVPRGISNLCDRLGAYRSVCPDYEVGAVDSLLHDLLSPYSR